MRSQFWLPSPCPRLPEFEADNSTVQCLSQLFQIVKCFLCKRSSKCWAWQCEFLFSQILTWQFHMILLDFSNVIRMILFYFSLSEVKTGSWVPFALSHIPGLHLALKSYDKNSSIIILYITNSIDMNLSKLQEMLEDSLACCSPWGRKEWDVTEQESYFEKKLWQRKNNTSLDCLLILQVKKSLFWLISHRATNLKNYIISWARNTVHNHRLLYNLIYRDHVITEKITQNFCI